MTNFPNFNHDKAYILGLLVGGGEISDDTFIINLPFDKWGMNPSNMSHIATDILTKICEKFRNSYNFSVGYDIFPKHWVIKPVGVIDLQPLTADLVEFGLPTQNKLITGVDLTVIKDKLKSIQVEHFLSGIFDTRASLAESHRRFTSDAPVVSLEVPGSSKNFTFVVQLCSWLTSLGTITDQILYNHPCQHSPADSDYTGWKKGFKIRFLAKSFLTNNSFAMQAKSFGVTKLEKSQTKDSQLPCKERKPKFTAISIHKDIASKDLPTQVRKHLFFHYHHICAVMGCPYAPIDEIKRGIQDYKQLISVFPKLSKGTLLDIAAKYNDIAVNYFNNNPLTAKRYLVSQLLESELHKSYPDLEVGIAYLCSPELNGKRHIGSKDLIIKNALNNEITVLLPENIEGTPIMLSNNSNNRAIIISSTTSKFNQQIVEQIVEINGIDVTVK
jgi:hypothetical protein